MDFVVLSRQLVRATRGPRSQLALSRRLGFRSNVVYRWEAGLRVPTGPQFLQLAARVGVDLDPLFRNFDPKTAAIAAGVAEPGSERHLAAWLRACRGSISVARLADETGLNRPSIRRILRGDTLPALPALLGLIQAMTGRQVDWIAGIVDPGELDVLGPLLDRQRAQVEVTYERRWTEAVLAAREVAQHLGAPPDAPWIAELLGIAEEEVALTLAALTRAGALAPGNEPRWTSTRPDAEAHRGLARHWLAQANLLPDECMGAGYLIASLDQDAIDAIVEILRRSVAEARTAISSAAPERVVGLSYALFSLDTRPLYPLASSNTRSYE